eukprot:gene68408-93747_t
MVMPGSITTSPSSGCSWPASMNRIWWPFCLEMLSRRIMGRSASAGGRGAPAFGSGKFEGADGRTSGGRHPGDCIPALPGARSGRRCRENHVSELLPLLAMIVGPVLVVALVSFLRRSVRFRWANVFRLYLSLMFGFFGLYGHILHPQGVVDLIPPFFPLRLESSYASGVLELAFA